MEKLVVVFLHLIPAFFMSQITVSVRELNYADHIACFDLNTEYLYVENRGHILEITVTNTSKNDIFFPLDTRSYGPTVSKNIYNYLRGDNIIGNPDMYHVFGIYPFIYQKGAFIDFIRADDPFYDWEDWEQKAKEAEDRAKEIINWKTKYRITDEFKAVYNWYMMKNMKKLNGGESFSYKLYFNPFLKVVGKYGLRGFYYNLKPNEPFEVTFKIIDYSDLDKFLLPSQLPENARLFKSHVESKVMIFNPQP